MEIEHLEAGTYYLLQLTDCLSKSKSHNLPLSHPGVVEVRVVLRGHPLDGRVLPHEAGRAPEVLQWVEQLNVNTN